jgi:hypothetical protein
MPTTKLWIIFRSNFVIPDSPACDGSTDSTFRDATKSSSVHAAKFFGKFSEWKNFRHTFESLVDSNDAMSNTLKFHYLKSNVTGNAALLINRLQISPENYTYAWKMLVMEYNDKRALIYTHIHSFASLPKSKFKSVTELKKLRDTVSAALSNLGCPVSHWNCLLGYIISEKFS